MPRTVSRTDLEAALAGRSATVVDALPAPAFARRHIPGAVNLVEEEADRAAADVLPDRSATVIVYSTDAGCSRGPGLARHLETLGYDDVLLYAQGIEDWVRAGLPVEKSDDDGS